MKEECPDLEAPVVELNPGIGLFTKELFESVGFKSITGLEESDKLSGLLKELFKDKGLHLVSKGFPEFPRLHHIDKVDGGNRLSSILNQIKVRFT